MRTGDPLTSINTRVTPQSEQADERQMQNSAGGFGFQISDEERARRFLMLGTEAGTYYTSDVELAKENAGVILRMARDHSEWLVNQIVEISTTGRAPRQNPAIFALAVVSAFAPAEGRHAALNALPAVCRTGTHLFLFAQYVEQVRGWGRGLRRAVANWYTNPAVERVAYQATKYRQRGGWSHRDLLRLAHPTTNDPQRRALFEWIVGRAVNHSDVPEIVNAFVRAQNTESVSEWVQLIQKHSLVWEHLPDAALREPKVWAALLETGLPQTALLRQLPRLTQIGAMTGDFRSAVVAQLTNAERLRRARVHPIAVLLAHRTYASGHSVRGSGKWTPDRRVIDALDEAFYSAFPAVQPAGKRTLVALDVSGSMGSSMLSSVPLSAREASAALSLVLMATEPEVDVVAFTSGKSDWWTPSITQLSISPRQRLNDAVRAVSNLPFGGTDCALPMTWALKKKREYDTFIVITDSESWAGSIHPHQALRQYRERMVPHARQIVVAMTATKFSVADPADPGSLDVVGFDAAVPTLIADFSRGGI
jgi:60 kDa SS-A/Ro ribonucleoprotein